MRIALPAVLGWCLLAGSAWAGDAVPGFPETAAMDAFGQLRIGPARIGWTLFGEGWRSRPLTDRFAALDQEQSRRAADSVTVAARWRAGQRDEEARFRSVWTALPDGSTRYAARIDSDDAIPMESLTWMAVMPFRPGQTVTVDGRDIVLPEKNDQVSLFGTAKAKRVSWVAAGRTVSVEGDFGVRIQDNRKWSPHAQIRFLPTAPKGKPLAVDFAVTLRVDAPRTAAFDLRAAANRGFADATAHDGRGGWTDQGPANDLSMLKPGELSTLAVRFPVVDPAANRGNGCLVLSAGQGGVPASAVVAAPPAPVPAPHLYLLHASAWTPGKDRPVGRIVATYAGGKTVDFPVVSGRDVGNWWRPYSVPNGAVAWTEANDTAHVGLYASQFALSGTPESVRFEVTDPQAMWMVVSALLGDRALALDEVRAPSHITAGERFFPVRFAGKATPASPLDLSAALDAPAGKYGPVVATPEGRFAFRDAPDRRIRFFGPNLVHGANYLDREAADALAGRLAWMGYNTLRFHHFENALLDKKAADSLTFDPKALDQLQYLFAAAKRRGLYSTIDLYASRKIRPGDGIAEPVTIKRYEMKALVPISPSAMANWKAFARNLLTAVNPHTGLSFAKDPALFSVNLINENILLSVWASNPEIVPLYEARFAEYLRTRNLDTPENRQRRDGLFAEFLNHLQAAAIAEQTRFLKEELGLAALVTDLNHASKFSMIPLRDSLDFVDNHGYWDHPNFPKTAWQLPHGYSQQSAVEQLARLPRRIMPTRIFGKPFTVTEFNFCLPNRWRVEAGPLMGAYAALQDWDGLYRFAWAHNAESLGRVAAPNRFDIVNDPMAQLGERIIHFLFLRGDAAAAEPAFGFRYDPGIVAGMKHFNRDGEFPDPFSRLGLYARIGTAMPSRPFAGAQSLDALAPGWERQLPEAARQALAGLDASGTVESATGEIRLSARDKSLRVVTPRSEVLTFGGKTAEGRRLRASNARGYQTLAAIALDGKPLAESGQVLVAHLANLLNNRMRFADEQWTLLESWGGTPLLAERVSAEVSLEVAGGRVVEALDLDGGLLGRVDAKTAEGVLRFTADTKRFPDGVMAYIVTPGGWDARSR